MKGNVLALEERRIVELGRFWVRQETRRKLLQIHGCDVTEYASGERSELAESLCAPVGVRSRNARQRRVDGLIHGRNQKRTRQEAMARHV